MVHQSNELLRVYGFLEVEIEAKIEIASRNRSGFQLSDVDSAGIDGIVYHYCYFYFHAAVKPAAYHSGSCDHLCHAESYQ